ncbi:MAG: phosphoglycerate dehydrogenase [Deferribacteraceae bacterium]|nr:phosphoglycerate dehydrogenase [Deferribacteraceae bacterium]
MAKFRILVSDHLAEEGCEILNADPDIEYDLKAGIKNSELKKIIGSYDALITRSGTTVTAELLEQPGRLKIICRAGVGLDNIDIETASKKGIIVMNAPTGNTLAAAELTMGMILSAARKIPAADNSLRSGKWERKRFMGIQLYDKVLGIVGLGRIGFNVAVRAKAFGMKIMVYDPYIKKEKADTIGAVLCQTLDELLAASDVVTLHTPLTPETRGIITKDSIAGMKNGAILVNCARGGLVDENGVSEAVKSGKLFSAATDVFKTEPPVNNPLTSTPDIFITPHIGANTHEGQKGVAIIICEQALNFLHGRPYLYAVNAPFNPSRLSVEMQRFFDLSEKVGKMAAQLTTGRMEELRFIMAGERFSEDLGERTFDIPFNYQPFTISMAKGYLEMFLHEPVSFVNAPYFAKYRGILLNETKVPEYNGMKDHIILTVKSDKEEVVYAATLFPDDTGRIVQIGPFRLDLIMEGNYLCFRNHDSPGIVGKVGALLGEHKINIANFVLTRLKPRGGEAASFVSVDDPIPQTVLEELLNLPGIISAKAITL